MIYLRSFRDLLEALLLQSVNNKSRQLLHFQLYRKIHNIQKCHPFILLAPYISIEIDQRCLQLFRPLRFTPLPMVTRSRIQKAH